MSTLSLNRCLSFFLEACRSTSMIGDDMRFRLSKYLVELEGYGRAALIKPIGVALFGSDECV